jgi:hypothetical protein
MNRAQRRAMRSKRYVAKCAMCEAESCVIHVQAFRAVDPTGPKDLGICKGCPCAVGKCDACGETGEHWLGCRLVGLPEGTPAGVSVQ